MHKIRNSFFLDTPIKTDKERLIKLIKSPKCTLILKMWQNLDIRKNKLEQQFPSLKKKKDFFQKQIYHSLFDRDNGGSEN